MVICAFPDKALVDDDGEEESGKKGDTEILWSPATPTVTLVPMYKAVEKSISVGNYIKPRSLENAVSGVEVKTMIVV